MQAGPDMRRYRRYVRLDYIGNRAQVLVPFTAVLEQHALFIPAEWFVYRE